MMDALEIRPCLDAAATYMMIMLNSSGASTDIAQ